MKPLTKGQMAALALSARYFLTFSGSTYNKEALQSALRKLEDGLDSRSLRNIRRRDESTSDARKATT